MGGAIGPQNRVIRGSGALTDGLRRSQRQSDWPLAGAATLREASVEPGPAPFVGLVVGAALAEEALDIGDEFVALR